MNVAIWLPVAATLDHGKYPDDSALEGPAVAPPSVSPRAKHAALATLWQRAPSC